MKQFWEREAKSGLIVADIGSGLGGTVLALAHEPRVELAIGVDNNPDSIKFAKLMTRKYANHPDLLRCIEEGVQSVPYRYTFEGMGYKMHEVENFSSIPYVPTGYAVPIGSLVWCLEHLGEKQYRPRKRTSDGI